MSPDRMWITRDPALPGGSVVGMLRDGPATVLSPPSLLRLFFVVPFSRCLFNRLAGCLDRGPVTDADGGSFLSAGSSKLWASAMPSRKRRPPPAGGFSQKSDVPKRGSRYLTSHPLRYTRFMHCRSLGWTSAHICQENSGGVSR